MKNVLLIIVIGIITVNSYSQSNCNIVKEYQKIFKIEKRQSGKREFLFKTVNKIDVNSCFSNLVNNNTMYISYLRTHFSDNSNYEKLMTINDSILLQKEFVKSLQKDKKFNNKLTKNRLNQFSSTLDTVSMNELLNIAIKYFSIIKVNNNGRYSGKVCAGINGIKMTEKERKPQVEAFCFSTILNNYQGRKFNMYNEFVNGIKELYKINLGVDKEDNLIRAQGAMYMFMRNNKTLKELLLYEYEKKKKYLPFVLKM